MKSSLDVPEHKVFEQVKDLFLKTPDYHTYRLIKKGSRYDDDAANKSNHMTKQTSVYMKDRAVFCKTPWLLSPFYKYSSPHVMKAISMKALRDGFLSGV